MPNINKHTLAHKSPLTAKQKKKLVMQKRARRLAADDEKQRKLEEKTRFDVERLKLDKRNKAAAELKGKFKKPKKKPKKNTGWTTGI